MRTTPTIKNPVAAQDIETLEGQIQSLLGNRVRDLRLLWTEKGWILQGVSQTYYAKQLAQHAVLAAAGLPLWANEIEVK